MRVTQIELGIVALIIGYIAFYTHPAPAHLQSFLESPVGKLIGLGGVLFVTVYHSLLVGVFLAIAYIMTVGSVTEYLDPKEQTPTDKKLAPVTQPKSAGVPTPDVHGALASLLGSSSKPSFKGDTRLPQAAQKKGVAPPKPSPAIAQPKPTPPKTVETFASF